MAWPFPVTTSSQTETLRQDKLVEGIHTIMLSQPGMNKDVLNTTLVSRWINKIVKLIGLYNQYAVDNREIPYSDDMKRTSDNIFAVLGSGWNSVTQQDAYNPNTFQAYNRLANAVVTTMMSVEDPKYLPGIPDDVFVPKTKNDDEPTNDPATYKKELTDKIIEYLDTTVPSSVQKVISAIPGVSWKSKRRALANSIADVITSNKPQSYEDVVSLIKSNVGFKLAGVDLVKYLGDIIPKIATIIWNFIKDIPGWVKKVMPDPEPDDDAGGDNGGDDSTATADDEEALLTYTPFAELTNALGVTPEMMKMIQTVVAIGLGVVAIGVASYFVYTMWIQPKLEKKRLETEKARAEQRVELQMAMNTLYSKENTNQFAEVGRVLKENPELVQLGATAAMAGATGGTSLAMAPALGAVTSNIPMNAQPAPVPTTIPVVVQ